MKTNENVRIETKRNKAFNYIHPLGSGRLFGSRQVIFWNFFWVRLFGPRQVIFWDFLRYILFHAVTSCAAARYNDTLLHTIRLFAPRQVIFGKYFGIFWGCAGAWHGKCYCKWVALRNWMKRKIGWAVVFPFHILFSLYRYGIWYVLFIFYILCLICKTLFLFYLYYVVIFILMNPYYCFMCFGV